MYGFVVVHESCVSATMFGFSSSGPTRDSSVAALSAHWRFVPQSEPVESGRYVAAIAALASAAVWKNASEAMRSFGCSVNRSVQAGAAISASARARRPTRGAIESRVMCEQFLIVVKSDPGSATAPRPPT
jgi:hypothetical protein